MRFWGPSPLVIRARFHEFASNLIVCLRAGPELLGEPSREGRASALNRLPGRFVPASARFSRLAASRFCFLALERLNSRYSDFSKWRHRTARPNSSFSEFPDGAYPRSKRYEKSMLAIFLVLHSLTMGKQPKRMQVTTLKIPRVNSKKCTSPSRSRDGVTFRLYRDIT